MKKIAKHILLLAFFLSMGLLSKSYAQKDYFEDKSWRPRIHHHALFWVGGGASMLNYQCDDAKPRMYPGAAAGLAFAVTFKSHWTVAVGAEIYQLDATTKKISFERERRLVDTEGDVYVMHYDFDGFRETQLLTYLNVPFNLTYFNRNYYFSLGVKVGGLLRGSYRSSVDMLTTEGQYEVFIDDFENMPNHFFTSKEQKQSEKLLSKLNIITSVEIGRNFFVKRPGDLFRIGLFFDYGIQNIRHGQQESDLVKYSDSDPTSVSFHSLTTRFTDPQDPMTSMMFGVKFSYMLRMRTIKQFSSNPCTGDYR